MVEYVHLFLTNTKNVLPYSAVVSSYAHTMVNHVKYLEKILTFIEYNFIFYGLIILYQSY